MLPLELALHTIRQEGFSLCTCPAILVQQSYSRRGYCHVTCTLMSYAHFCSACQLGE